VNDGIHGNFVQNITKYYIGDMNKKTVAGFIASLSSEELPDGLSVYEKSLWWAGKGDWEKAHELIQDVADKQGAQIHAFLHRKEGDISNARYWYAKADSLMPALSLEDEWESLVAYYFQ
jgi:hypothetical protein